MPTTTGDLIEATRSLLYSGQRPGMNKLATGVSPGAGTLTFSNPLQGIKENAYVQLDLEVFYVWSVDDASKQAVVSCGQLGSIPAVHDAGDVAVVNPRFFDHEILRALNNCLNSLSAPASGLYQSKTVDLSWTGEVGGYDLAGVTDLIAIEDIRLHRTAGMSKDWPKVQTWDVGRSVNTTDFPSGLALFLLDTAEQGSNVRVRYRSGFGQLTTLSEDAAAVTGLPTTALDIPPLGAAIRLVHPREIKRNATEAQGDGRRAGEVTPGAVAGSVNALERDYQRRIREEAGRLSQQNPAQGFVPLPSPYAVRRRVLSNRD